MMQNDCKPSPERVRLLKRLAVIVDDRWPDEVQLAAIRAVQASLAPSNSLRSRSAQDLLELVKRPWATRPYLENGRAVYRLVCRPPVSLADVW